MEFKGHFAKTGRGRNMAEGRKKPNPIDIHVGARIKLKRTMKGLSQEKLADQLGITFQQVQKYEKASNRIGASRLKEIADFLEVPVGFFYEGLQSASQGFAEEGASAFMTDFLATSEGLELNRSFLKIKDPKVRKRILELVRTLSSDED